MIPTLHTLLSDSLALLLMLLIGVIIGAVVGGIIAALYWLNYARTAQNEADALLQETRRLSCELSREKENVTSLELQVESLLSADHTIYRDRQL